MNIPAMGMREQRVGLHANRFCGWGYMQTGCVVIMDFFDENRMQLLTADVVVYKGCGR
jgi:hypothetical protein